MDETDCYVPFFRVVTLDLDLEGYLPIFALAYEAIYNKTNLYPDKIRNDIRRNLKWQKRK